MSWRQIIEDKIFNLHAANLGSNSDIPDGLPSTAMNYS